jgi:hypothetical protein
MTNVSRVPAIRLLVLGMLVFAATCRAQNKPPIVPEIAKAYGLDSFGQIEQIRYTFNVDLPGIKLSRKWVWEPQTGRVSYDSSFVPALSTKQSGCCGEGRSRSGF